MREIKNSETENSREMVARSRHKLSSSPLEGEPKPSWGFWWGVPSCNIPPPKFLKGNFDSPSRGELRCGTAAASLTTDDWRLETRP